jgi:hypothetical protein
MLAVGCNAPKPAATTAAAKPTPASEAGAAVATLAATRDARVMFYPNEAEFNGGGSDYLRASNINGNGAECGIVDFDRTALKAALAKNQGKTVTVTLKLTVRDVILHPSGTLRVVALDTASDWTEGNKSWSKADKGQCCAKAARFDEKPWTTADGKEVATLRDLFFDISTRKEHALANQNPLLINATDKGKTVSVVLQPRFVEHLANDPACKGIVLFTHDEGVLLDVDSREKGHAGPTLTISVK